VDSEWIREENILEGVECMIQINKEIHHILDVWIKKKNTLDQLF
jgi:hypothetical protein